MSGGGGGDQVEPSSKMKRRRRRRWARNSAVWLLLALLQLVGSSLTQQLAPNTLHQQQQVEPKSTQQTISSNMSMSAFAQAHQQLMTNSSLAGNSSAAAAATSRSGANLAKSAPGQTKSAQSGGAQSSGDRQQQQQQQQVQHASPAFNSRQQSLRQQREQAANSSDNQMAADDAHETLAMGQARQWNSDGAGLRQEHSAASNANKTNSKTRPPAGAPTRAASSSVLVGGGGWQTINSASASITSPASSASSQSQSQQQQPLSTSAASSWRPRAQAKLALALPPPPAPVGYISRPAQVASAAPSWQQAAEQQQQRQTGAVELAAQLEKPTGYSYDSASSYTHTARPEAGAKWPPSRQRAVQADLAPPAGRSSALELQHARVAAAAAAATPRPGLGPQMPLSSAGAFSPSPCRPPGAGHLFGQPQQQHELSLLNEPLAMAASSLQAHSGLAPRYLRAGDGTRLRSHFVFKVLRADSLTDCESACTRASSQLDACRSFNYRAYFAAENCELSRHSLEQLKLEDGAQFEQHTQFDFYALEQSSGGQMQVQQLIDPLAGGECLDVSQSCSQDGMEFTLRTSEPFNGRIYTYGFYDSCFVDGDQSSSSVLRISRANGFPRCGTQQLGDLMTNIVVVQFNDHVQTTRDKKYNLTCYFSGPAEAVVTSNYLDAKVDERSHPIQIEHLPPQNVITSNVHLRVLYRGQPTNTIAVGDLLTFRLETGAAGQRATGAAGPSSAPAASMRMAGADQLAGQNEIFATNVIAKDPYSGRQVQLIDARGCPVDSANVFPELQRTPDGALESEFYAFKIPDSNFLIFQATVRTCKAPCEPVICSTSPAATAQQQQQSALQHQHAPLATSAAIKSGASLGAYLMAPHASSAPSWGRRRRRRQVELAELGGGADEQLGESVEHIIPVRLQGGRSGGVHSRPVVTRVKRPDLSEPEEEVKEMFRVYMSRAELDRQRRERAGQRQLDRPDQAAKRDGQAEAQAQDGANLQQSPLEATTRRDPLERPAQLGSLGANEQLDELAPICVAQATYYLMLFSLISLSLLVCSVFIVAAYVTRKAKFRISDSLADSMF